METRTTEPALADPDARAFLRGADPVLARIIDARPDFRPRAWTKELPGLDAFSTLIFATGGRYITSLPKFFRDGIWWFEREDAGGVPYALNLQILVLVVAFVVAWLLLNRTNVGRQIYAVGGNKDAAQRLGFHIFRINLLVFGMKPSLPILFGGVPITAGGLVITFWRA